jgi:hypothetical protein
MKNCLQYSLRLENLKNPFTRRHKRGCVHERSNPFSTHVQILSRYGPGRKYENEISFYAIYTSFAKNRDMILSIEFPRHPSNAATIRIKRNYAMIVALLV